MMANDTIDKIRDLFNRNNIVFGIEQFHLYIHAVIAEFVLSDDSSTQFSDYRAAWNSPRAGASKKYSLAMPYFLRHCTQANGIIVFDANPDFILKASEFEFSAGDSILFVQNSRRLAMLYKQRFPSFNFAFYQSKGEKETVFVQVDIEEQYEGKELRFVSQPISKVYGAAIVFARCESEPLLGKIVKDLADKIDAKNGSVY